MKRSFKRAFALVLALTLLVSAGCTGGNPQETKAAMGRYVESECPLPANFTLISGLRKTADGALELLGFTVNAENQNRYDLRYYRSTDRGQNWTEDTPSWLDTFFNGEDSKYGAEHAAWGPDGTLWFYVQQVVDDEYGTAYARLDGETVTVMDWPAPYASDGSGVSDFSVAENGDLILNCGSEFLQIDPAKGTTKNVYVAEDGSGGNWNDGWAVTGNTLALSEASRIVRYDLSTGKEISSLSCQGATFTSYDFGSYYRIMDFGTDGNLYFADSKGINRTVEGNDTLEQLADGSLLSLSTPSVKLQKLLVFDNQFFVLAWSNQVWKLYSYTYDPNVPTLPDTELTIWSLTDDPLISQAISQLQKNDPGVHVTYTVGMPVDGSVTKDDAIRTLSTQITAGKGPDVLVLDGLPYASYVEKGVLADISGQLKALDGTGVLLSNIVNAYRQPDDKTYALPTQFQVPMLHGSSDAMNSIKDLKTMADWLEEAKDSLRTPFLFDSSANIIRALYPSCLETITTPEGNIDEGGLRDFLTQIKRMTDLREDPEEAESENDFTTDFDFGPLGWTAGYNGLDLGNLVQFQGLYAAWTASDKKGDGSTDTLFGADAYLPVTTLGITAQSKQQELAWKFIEAALSDEVQGQAVGKGIPVSLKAYTNSTTQSKTRDDGVFSSYGTSFLDAEGAIVPVAMQVMYPPEEYRQQMAELFKGLSTPILYDETVLQLIIDGSKDYISSKSDLDTAVSGIMQKLKLYEAE